MANGPVTTTTMQTMGQATCLVIGRIRHGGRPTDQPRVTCNIHTSGEGLDTPYEVSIPSTQRVRPHSAARVSPPTAAPSHRQADMSVREVRLPTRTEQPPRSPNGPPRTTREVPSRVNQASSVPTGIPASRVHTAKLWLLGPLHVSRALSTFEVTQKTSMVAWARTKARAHSSFEVPNKSYKPKLRGQPLFKVHVAVP